MRLIAVTAVEAERAAVLRHFGGGEPVAVGPYAGLSATTPAGTLTVVAAGVGMAAAAAATATALAGPDGCDAVLSLGVGGGFDGRARPGDVVVATELVAADLGSWSPDGFLTVSDLGFGDTVIAAGPMVAAIAARVGAVAGPIVTVAAATGSDERAAELARRWAPYAEAMEGYGVAVAARAYGVPAYELRAISNRCGARDRAAWELPRAIDTLAAACGKLFAEAMQ